MKENKRPSELHELFQYAGAYKYLSIASWLLSAGSALLALVPFVYIWRIIDEALAVAPRFNEAVNMAHYGWMALAYALLSIIIYITGLICSHLAAFRIAANIRIRLMQHIVTLSLGFITPIGSGKLRKIVNESSAATETYLAHNLPDKAGSLAMPAGLLALLLYFDWRLGLLSLVPAVLAFVILYVFMIGKDLKRQMAEYQQALDRMSNEAVEYVRGIPVVKTFGQSVFSFKRFKEAIDSYGQWVIAYTLKLRKPMIAYTLCINGVFALLIATVLLMTAESITRTFLLNLIYYIIITPIITVILTKIMLLSQSKMIVAEALERINGVLNMQPLPEPNQGKRPQDNSIRLTDVSFRYKGAHCDALQDISLYITAGEHVAFVGPSGGGKTTLASIIARFWDADKGTVEIGGVNVRDITKEELMRHVSFVFQDSKLIKGTILDNVRMGRPEATPDEVRAVLSKAQCDDIIEKMPNGILTTLGTGGIYLSGGERQRIAIARVMLQNTPVLILDEATAFADPDNERRVQAAFSAMGEGKTVIMIAHRLSTVVGADRIFVLRDGKICETGTHLELKDKPQGVYAKMWNEYNKSVKWNIGGTA